MRSKFSCAEKNLSKAGFEWVTERNGIKLYRKPKTFTKLRDRP